MRNYTKAEARAIRCAWARLEKIAETTPSAEARLAEALRMETRKEACGSRLTAAAVLMGTLADCADLRIEHLDGLRTGHLIALSARAQLNRWRPAEMTDWRREEYPAVKAADDAATERILARVGA